MILCHRSPASPQRHRRLVLITKDTLGLKTLKRLFLMVSLPVSRVSIEIGLLTCIYFNQLSVVVSLIYWTLILLLPTLIIQKDPSVSEPSDSPVALVRIPLPTDLSLHFVPAAAQLLDFLLLERPFSLKEVRVFAPRMAALFGLWYSIWVEYCASYNGRCESSLLHPNRSGSCFSLPSACIYANAPYCFIYPLVPYPFLDHPLPIRIPIYIFVTFLAVGLLNGINGVHAALISAEAQQSKKKVKAN